MRKLRQFLDNHGAVLKTAPIFDINVAQFCELRHNCIIFPLAPIDHVDLC